MEVANALVVKERQKRIDNAHLTEVAKQIADLPIEVDLVTASEVFPRVVPLARRHQLTVHDACYLELALRAALPLATLNNALRRAAERDGIPLLVGTHG